MSRVMRLPTMWHFDMNRLRQTCAASLSFETPNYVWSVAEHS